MAKKDKPDEPDELDGLDGLFKPKPKPKVKAKPTPKAKAKAKTPSKPTEPEKPTGDEPTESDAQPGGFFGGGKDSNVAIAIKMAEVEQLMKDAKSKKAISDLLAAVNLTRNGSELRTFRIGENFGDLVDRLQDLLRYSYGFKRREVAVRTILELILSRVADDLEANGPDSEFIRMMLEDKHIKE